ncbi:MAG: type II toxin-antitoxin system HicA family toxin [Elusimicrobia bacterium]|nr:type II toxin-antitoxin system HicA family toxin [Elusimicrobiota bacterium]
MVRLAKLLQLARRNPGGLRFSDLCRLAEAFGFRLRRQKGSHRIYAHEGTRRIMNFQNDRGTAKAYQVRQLLDCIDQNRLAIGGRRT